MTVISRSHASFNCYGREYWQCSSPNGSVARGDGRSCLLGFGHFRTACILQTTLRPDHERRFPTTGRARRCLLLAEHGHRWPESQKGALEYHTSQGCLWRHRHSSHHDPSKFPSSLRRNTSGSHMARKQWSTNGIMSISACTAPRSVEPSTGPE